MKNSGVLGQLASDAHTEYFIGCSGPQSLQLKVIFPTYVVGAQKNRLIETVLLSTHKTCLNFILLDKKKITISSFS